MAEQSKPAQQTKTAAPAKAVRGGGKAAKPGIGQRLGRYFNDVRAEMRRVVWPTRAEIISSSWIVVITLIIFVVLIFAFDQLSTVLIGALAKVGG